MLLPSTVALRVNQRLLNIRVFSSTPARSDALKTPVQQLGWEYLQRQKALGRPISPHLTIYKPQLTWMVSGAHRISGCIMAGTLLVGGVGFAVLPIDFTTFIDFVKGLNLPGAVTSAFKFIVAFPIVFHTLNGIRFLGFDLAKGVDNIGQVYKGGYLVLALSTIIALIIVVKASCSKKEKH